MSHAAGLRGLLLAYRHLLDDQRSGYPHRDRGERPVDLMRGRVHRVQSHTHRHPASHGDHVTARPRIVVLVAPRPPRGALSRDSRPEGVDLDEDHAEQTPQTRLPS